MYATGKLCIRYGTIAPTYDNVTKYAQGGGGTLVFSYIRRLGSFFGLKTLNFNIFLGFSEKLIIYFWGMKILWIFFGGHHKIGLYLGVISMHFRVFS